MAVAGVVFNIFKYYVLAILIAGGFLMTWVTDDDIAPLSKNKVDRYVDLCYYVVASSTSTGYGDITARSRRARIFASILMVIVYSFVLTVGVLGICNPGRLKTLKSLTM